MKEILQQLIQELIKMSILELQEFRSVWLLELEQLKVPASSKIICSKLIEQVIEIKESEVM